MSRQNSPVSGNIEPDSESAARGIERRSRACGLPGLMRLPRWLRGQCEPLQCRLCWSTGASRYCSEKYGPARRLSSIAGAGTGPREPFSANGHLPARLDRWRDKRVFNRVKFTATPPPAVLEAALRHRCHKAFTIGSLDRLIWLAMPSEAIYLRFMFARQDAGRMRRAGLRLYFCKRNKLCEPFLPATRLIFERNRWRKGFPIWRRLNGSLAGTSALLKRFTPGIAAGRLNFSSGSRRIELLRRTLCTMYS